MMRLCPICRNPLKTAVAEVKGKVQGVFICDCTPDKCLISVTGAEQGAQNGQR